MDTKIELTEKLFLGKGMHKACYIDPRDDSRVVKIVLKMPDVDIKREMSYRRSRERRHLSSELLTHYFGTVETNYGTGYVFERVCDFDGSTSLDIGQYFALQGQNGAENWPAPERVLQKFRRLFLQEKIVTTNMEYVNFALQRVRGGGR